MKRFLVAGLASLMLMAGFAVAQDTTGDTAKTEQVHGKESSGEVQDRLDKAAQVMDQLSDTKDSAIPDKILKDAHCVMIIPSMVKGGFVFGAEHGRGVASCRVNGRWSAPAFFAATGGNLGRADRR